MWITRDFNVNDCRVTFADQSLPYDQQQPIVDSTAWAAPSRQDSFPEGVAPWEGEYDKAFETLKQIGKGAFGHVNLAQKRGDQLVVRLLNALVSIC